MGGVSKGFKYKRTAARPGGPTGAGMGPTLNMSAALGAYKINGEQVFFPDAKR